MAYVEKRNIKKIITRHWSHPGWEQVALRLFPLHLEWLFLLRELKPQTSFHRPWASPPVTSACSHDCSPFRKSLQSLMDRFPLAITLPGNVFQQDLCLNRSCFNLVEECVCACACVCVTQLPIPPLSLSGWKRNCKLHGLSGSPIIGTLRVLNFCLCESGTIMTTLLI